MHHLNILTQKRQRPLRGCARATLLSKCFVGKYMVMCRDAHPQVTNLIFAKNQGLLYLDFFNLEPRIIRHYYKINSPLLKLWMDFFKDMTTYRQWIKKIIESKHINLTSSACEQGEETDNVIFTTWKTCTEDKLSSYPLADVFIDKFSYKRHNITRDPPSAGVLLLKLCWGAFISSLNASLLHGLGIPRLVCYSFQEYHDKALKRKINEIVCLHCKWHFQIIVNNEVMLHYIPIDA